MMELRKYGSGDWPSYPVLGIRLLPVVLWVRREPIPKNGLNEHRKIRP
jgi:hypothetical protein